MCTTHPQHSTSHLRTSGWDVLKQREECRAPGWEEKRVNHRPVHCTPALYPEWPGSRILYSVPGGEGGGTWDGKDRAVYPSRSWGGRKHRLKQLCPFLIRPKSFWVLTNCQDLFSPWIPVPPHEVGIIILIPCYRWGNWGFGGEGRLNDVPKVTESVRTELEFEPGARALELRTVPVCWGCPFALNKAITAKRQGSIFRTFASYFWIEACDPDGPVCKRFRINSNRGTEARS